MNVYDEMKLLIEKKLAKLDKFFASEAEATVTLSSKRNEKTIELTISSEGTLFRSEVGAESFRDALDEALSNIERRIRKNKTRLSKRLRTAPPPMAFDADFDDLEPDEEEILRTKTYSARPMSSEDAILQMNLLGHQFFVYVDAESEQTCVVYQRKDGKYGLLIPEE